MHLSYKWDLPHVISLFKNIYAYVLYIHMYISFFSPFPRNQHLINTVISAVYMEVIEGVHCSVASVLALM